MTRVCHHFKFFQTSGKQSNDFARRLGCKEYGEAGNAMERKFGRTSVPGLYIIGDASRDILQISIFVGEGAEAAITLHRELLEDEGIL